MKIWPPATHLVVRNTGRARSFIVVDGLRTNLQPRQRLTLDLQFEGIVPIDVKKGPHVEALVQPPVKRQSHRKR